jgi:ATP phosphoribosyltransferase regulatory subunit
MRLLDIPDSVPALESARELCKNSAAMNDTASKALLPEGLQDLLPPDAAREAALGARLLACFHSHGYERVKPPIIEFEDSLLSGAGAGLSESSFRLMDPVSRRMMALRSDMTPQVARIARTRLARAPRPLRLSYSGDILRVQGSELRPERQFAQVGFELIGAATPHADAEVVLLAVEGLAGLGLENLTVDISAPTLVTAILDGLDLGAESHASLRGALDSKDGAGIAGLAGAADPALQGLLAATGPARPALAALAKLDLPEEARAAARALSEVATLVLETESGLGVTIDPVERRGFEYQTGVSFTLFVEGVRGELGRGGRYPLGTNGTPGEEAAGCTLYMDSLLRAVPGGEAPRRILLARGTEPEAAAGLRAAGWIAIAALSPSGDDAAEARRLGCSHLYAENGIAEVQPEE